MNGIAAHASRSQDVGLVPRAAGDLCAREIDAMGIDAMGIHAMGIGAMGIGAMGIDAMGIDAMSAALALPHPAGPDGASDHERINRITALERLEAAAAAAQLREVAAVDASQRAVQRATGLSDDRVGAGIAAQIALAARISPWRAARLSGWARVLINELPQTFARLQLGEVTEWRALLVARESAWLSREQRRTLDAELAPRLREWGDRRVEHETRRAAYRLDPRGYVDRLAAAEADRYVGIRPAPDMMARLSALLPLTQAVAAHAALVTEAKRRKAAGDPRGRNQIAADLLVARLTGTEQASGVNVEIELIMTDQTLFGAATTASAASSVGGGVDDDREEGADRGADGDADEPGHLIGFGPIPASVARAIALGNGNGNDGDGDGDGSVGRRYIRRLYRHPVSGELMAMEGRRRLFSVAQRRLLRLRDQICRTPWCDAPIEHADHIEPAARGGPTCVDNGQGYCQACNYAKQAPDWVTTAERHGDGSTSVRISTPTGHTYASRPPDPPGTRGRHAA